MNPQHPHQPPDCSPDNASEHAAKTPDEIRADYLAGIYGDHRRAAALIAHYGRQDSPGYLAVIDEAKAAHRISELLVAIFNVYSRIVPRLTDADVIAQAQHLALQWADDETTEGN